mmetsp:Transcript_5924/g.5083  ORF Transcript_5924/g.5083 Transcript_5924/m.5083 type:complete len:86 (-) Transcript_5924:123-380(-)
MGLKNMDTRIRDLNLIPHNLRLRSRIEKQHKHLKTINSKSRFGSNIKTREKNTSDQSSVKSEKSVSFNNSDNQFNDIQFQNSILN